MGIKFPPADQVFLKCVLNARQQLSIAEVDDAHEVEDWLLWFFTIGSKELQKFYKDLQFFVKECERLNKTLESIS